MSAAKKWILGAIAVAAVGFFLFVLFAKEGSRNKIINVGDSAPEFRLSSLDGKEVSLSDLRGKVVLVHFWATWCPPCVEEMPMLDKLNREFAGKDFEILAVSVDQNGAAAVQRFMEKNKLNLPVLLDPKSSIAGRYGTFKFPETYVLDRTGVVRYKVIGALDWTAADSMSAIRGLVEQK